MKLLDVQELKKQIKKQVGERVILTKNNRAWAGLAYAIIVAAERDYVKNNSYSQEAEMFFNSYWYENLREMVALVNPPKVDNAPSVHNEIH